MARGVCLGFRVSLALAAAIVARADCAEPIKPNQATPLFNGKDLAGLKAWLKETQRDDPRQVFSAAYGMIRASGEGNGYLAPDNEYRDYHLVVEYKWGQRTNGGKYVRNSGILLHAVGPDGGGIDSSTARARIVPELVFSRLSKLWIVPL